jgi:dihydroorotate dehydrogenase electron transfer subunit
MRSDANDGWLEFLYKPVGEGLRKLARRQTGERLSMLAPIGNGFKLDPARPRVLALGGGVGIPPMVFLAESLAQSASFSPIVLMGSEVPFPFELIAATGNAADWPADARSSLALLEHWGVTSRLASKAGIVGAHAGFVTDLARFRLGRDLAGDLARTQIVACGPEPMLASAASLAREMDLPCQLAVEEFMACGVGGCAGCTIRLHTATGPAMKRVCVDGPVFDAREVYP